MALTVFEIGHADGNAGRIKPSTFEPSDGSWLLALGSERSGVFVKVNTLDFVQWEQIANFDITKVFRFRARVRGPANYPALGSVFATTDTYGFDITLPGQAAASVSYVADTAGLPVVGQTGAVASIDAFSPTTQLVTVSGLTGMTSASVGKQLEVSGAATPASNGKFVIREFVSLTSVKYQNASGAGTDANNGSIAWTERRRDDDATTIAQGIVAAINANAVAATAKHLVDGALSVSPNDLDTDILINNPIPSAGFMKLATAPRWQMITSVGGTTISTIEIEPRTTRDLFDQGTQVSFLTAGNKSIRFGLSFNSLSPSIPSGGPFEVELPGVFIDSLVFDEVT